MRDKTELRRELLARRNSISPQDKQAWDIAINKAIIARPWFQQAQTILAYYPVGSEPDIRPALERALRQGKRVYLPRCERAARKMTFHQIQSLEGLRPGAHGIPEPEKNHCQLLFVNCVLCLVPGIAFDKAGFRLGYGGGYYDRFLARHDDLRTLGVCYEGLLRACLPRDALDIAVESVITEGEHYERERQAK